MSAFSVGQVVHIKCKNPKDSSWNKDFWKVAVVRPDLLILKPLTSTFIERPFIVHFHSYDITDASGLWQDYKKVRDEMRKEQMGASK